MKRLLIMTLVLVTLLSCGPVLISSSPDRPPPPWLYPNRLETVRYVYFPDYMIYYDLSLGTYLYLDSGAWITVNVLPPRFSRIDLRRSRYVRIRDYRGDDIRSYHRTNRYNRGYRVGDSRTRGSNYSRTRSDRDKNTTTRSRSNTSTRSRSTSNRSKNKVTRSRSRDSL